MADDIENDDQWLYGENQDPEPEHPKEKQLPQVDPPAESSSPTKPQEPEEEEQQKENLDQSESKDSSKEEGEEDDDEEKQNGEGTDKEEDEEDDSDDDINVVIGDIKTNPTYTSLNIKRGGLLTSSSGDKKQQQQPGKFAVEEFEQVGTINGVPATEFNLDSLEDKPWRKPGADITDYFNYGFNEDTWRAYCERQKRLRVSESGVGLAPLNAIGMPRGPLPIMNDNSKYSGNFMGIRKAGPPPGRRMTGAIDVIGSGQRVGPGGKAEPPKENVIQVLTADRREYSRKMPGFPDLSVPPPNTFEEFPPEYGFNPEPEPFYGGYEPTQDSQWDSGQDSWAPQEIKTLTGVPPTGPPPMMGPPMPMPIPVPSPSLREPSPGRERDRESRGRSEKPRDRERDKSRRRERSRSRSRRHRSRSRSPGHRSHKKKKSRRHEDSD